MKVVLAVQISGTRDGTDWPPVGSVIDLPDHEAVAMLGAGQARPVARETAVRETAVIEHPDTAMAKPAKGKS